MAGEELNILSKIKVRPVEEQRDYLLEQNMLLTGKIATLEKENAELNNFIMQSKKDGISPINALIIKNLGNQLTKAKDHIKKLLGCLQQDTNDPQTNYYVVKYMTEAEQFLSEVKK